MSGFLAFVSVLAVGIANPDSVPPVEESITPDCLRFCPNGDICQDVQVIWEDEPVAFTDVRMVFNMTGNDQIYWCPGQVHPVITTTTDADGRCAFRIRAGGCYPWAGPHAPPQDDPGCVVIAADPGDIVLNSYEDVGSPDCHTDGVAPPNGDGDVDLMDFVVFSQMFGSNHHCGDFDDDGTIEGDGVCDEDVDLLDFVIFAQHFGHTCDHPVW